MKIVKGILISLLLAILVLPVTVVPVAAQEIVANPLLATITGLEAGESVTLTIQTESAPTDSAVILEKSDVGVSDIPTTIDMACNLSDGYYQLMLTAPEKYFRSPKGYFFCVSGGKVLNPCNRAATFSLSPAPSTPVLEPIIGLSAPKKQSLTTGVKKLGFSPMHTSDGRHYFHYRSTLQCPGISGRMAVTNPSVIHDYSYNNYFVDHIYATDSETLQQHWIEAGWAEVSWLVDTQYVFTYDSTNQTWYFYSSMLNPLYVRLVASGTTWYAQEWLGTYWAQLGWGVDLGYSQAVIMYSGGEVYHTAYGNHPSLPSTNTDISQLYISGNWVNWDTQFSSTTSVKILPTGATQYGLTTYTSYYNFSIYSN